MVYNISLDSLQEQAVSIVSAIEVVATAAAHPVLYSTAFSEYRCWGSRSCLRLCVLLVMLILTQISDLVSV